jgi:SAM-dependent methyltransferase
MAAALAVLLGTGGAGRRELGESGERFARRVFDIGRHALRLEALYHGDETAAQRAAARPAVVPAAGGPIRLHLGCGSEHRDGWVNVDSRAVVGPDVVARVDALPMFPDGSVDTIEACHLLEHLPLLEAKRAVGEWFRLLKNGGELLLELPNLEACVRILGEHPDRHGYDLGMIGIFGWPAGVEADGVAQVHKWGWTPVSLADALREAGFSTVETLPITQTWRPASRVNRDFRVRAVKAA